MAMFDQLRKERKLNRELLEKAEASFSVQKSSPWLWIFISIIGSGSAGALAYCVVITYLKCRSLFQTQASAPRYPMQQARNSSAEYVGLANMNELMKGPFNSYPIP